MRFGAARATVENLRICAVYFLFAAQIAVVAQGEFGYCGENWIAFHGLRSFPFVEFHSEILFFFFIYIL